MGFLAKYVKVSRYGTQMQGVCSIELNTILPQNFAVVWFYFKALPIWCGNDSSVASIEIDTHARTQLW